MAPLLHDKPANLDQVEWLTTFAFLGALCFTVLGIKLKWFRAQMTFGSSDTETNNVQSTAAVYRPYSADVYSPSYREIDENVSKTKESVPQRPATLHTSNPVQQTSKNKPHPSSTDINRANVQSTSKAGGEISSTAQSTHKSKSKNKSKVKKDDKTDRNEKTLQKKKEEKPKKEEGAITKKDEEVELKKEKEAKLKKEKQEKSKKEAKEKLKKDKEEKLKKEAKEKLKKDKEEKLKQEKEEKAKKQKDEKKSKKTSHPVASVTIDDQYEMEDSSSRPPAYSKEPQTRATNTKTKTVSEVTDAAEGFTSSWDMVTAHRQNLQRDVKPQTNNNMRSMANQNKTEVGVHNNTLFTPQKSGPKDVAKVSYNSDNSEDGDTEA